MKKFLLIVAVAWMAAVNGWAQRLQVLDSEGNPIPYASVLTPQAEYIGITNLEGVVDDVKGAKDITITHVAFKTKNVKPDGKDVVVTLEDADFDMPEITIPYGLTEASPVFTMSGAHETLERRVSTVGTGQPHI